GARPDRARPRPADHGQPGDLAGRAVLRHPVRAGPADPADPAQGHHGQSGQPAVHHRGDGRHHDSDHRPQPGPAGGRVHQLTRPPAITSVNGVRDGGPSASRSPGRPAQGTVTTSDERVPYWCSSRWTSLPRRTRCRASTAPLGPSAPATPASAASRAPASRPARSAPLLAAFSDGGPGGTFSSTYWPGGSSRTSGAVPPARPTENSAWRSPTSSQHGLYAPGSSFAQTSSTAVVASG